MRVAEPDASWSGSLHDIRQITHSKEAQEAGVLRLGSDPFKNSCTDFAVVVSEQTDADSERHEMWEAVPDHFNRSAKNSEKCFQLDT